MENDSAVSAFGSSSRALPEPPSLQVPHGGFRLLVGLGSGLLYTGLLAGTLALTRNAQSRPVPRRTMAIDLWAAGEPFVVEPVVSPRVAPGGTVPPPREVAAPLSDSTPAPSPEPAATADVPPISTSPAGGDRTAVTPGAPTHASGGREGAASDSSSEAVVPPRFDAAYLRNPEPRSPPLSKQLGEEGRVVLRVLVNAEGQVEQAEVRQSSGHPRLDQAALGVIHRWRFMPARHGPERLAAWVLVPISFQLDA
jgi:periplasmic protein TonB